jgi:hypothetical protein
MITIVLSYYENGLMLERHLEEWASYAPGVKSELHAVVVDDGSPRDPAVAHLRNVGFPVDLYRIKQNLIWNVAGARNLGMTMAPDGWCLLTDIDHLLKAEDAAKLTAVVAEGAMNRAPTYYYLARRRSDGSPLHAHRNSYVIERALYWRAGGCDEDYTGWWGAGESQFRGNLNLIVGDGRDRTLHDIYLTHFGRRDICDASTREWGRKGTAYDYSRNPALKCKRAPYRPENPLRFDWERAN